MPPSEPAVDRRAQIRERHHRAIIDAAAALLDAKGPDGFTVEELAQRAEVSRRTVFNHFASVDDIVIAVCSEVLGDVVDTFEAHASASVGPTHAGVFDEVAGALRSTDLVTPIAYLTRVLRAPDADPSQRQFGVLLRAFTEVSERLSAELLRRHPKADEFTTRLLLSSLIGGLVVLHTHWLAATGGSADEASRAVWDDLLDQLIRRTRDGYASTAPLGAQAP
jgi:AcrR family transcriptional regulator